uniref:Protein phosphatase 1 regulatory subunit 35 C-terminal domain-containing protein n=1 Tax=Varanus komodoensis TaxID=61221 RepID=A0A8D2LDV6_VARKO
MLPTCSLPPRSLSLTGAAARLLSPPSTMAATLSLSCGDDRDSFPCTAPSPLPPPQSRSLSPDPDVALTPERSCAGRAGGGILRRRLQGRPPRRQVHGAGEGGSKPPGWEARRRRGKECQDPWRAPCGTISECFPTVLATPVPHSTLALGAEVQSAQEQGFDARQAAEALVQSSFVARCAVEAQVGPGMNIPRDQQLYQGLVSLRVPEDELLSSAVQEKLALVRHRPEAKRSSPHPLPPGAGEQAAIFAPCPPEAGAAKRLQPALASTG